MAKEMAMFRNIKKQEGVVLSKFEECMLDAQKLCHSPFIPEIDNLPTQTIDSFCSRC